LTIVKGEEEIISQFKIHLFRGTLEKIFDQNAYKLKEYFTFPIGRHRIGKYEYTDSILTITPKDSEKGYLPTIQFNKGEGIEATFTDLHFDGHGTIEQQQGKFFGYINKLKINFRLSPPPNDGHIIDLIPDVRVERVFAEFENENMGIENIYGETMSNAGIKNHIKEWVRNSIDARSSELNGAFYDLHTVIAEWVESFEDIKNFKGRIRLSVIHFYENYAEIFVRLMFPKDSESDMVTKTGIFKDQHMPSQEGVEFIFDENVINTILYAIYHLDPSVRVREFLKNYLENTPDVEYFFKVSNFNISFRQEIYCIDGQKLMINMEERGMLT